MPRYHFNVHDSQNIVDKKGIELTDLYEARLKGIRSVAEFLKDEASQLGDGMD